MATVIIITGIMTPPFICCEHLGQNQSKNERVVQKKNVYIRLLVIFCFSLNIYKALSGATRQKNRTPEDQTLLTSTGLQSTECTTYMNQSEFLSKLKAKKSFS